MRQAQYANRGVLETRELKSGLTWRTILVLLLPIVVFHSGLIYLSLVTGGSFGLGWITLLIAVELARMLGKPLTKQEAFIIMTLATPVGATYFLGYIYRVYFSRNALFGISEYIPTWWVPKVPEIWLRRTFFHPSWLMPISIGILFLLLTSIADITMGLFTRELYVEVEKLPFPTAEVVAQGILTLVEREEGAHAKRMSILLFGANIASIYSLILYGPLFLLPLLGYTLPSIPVPWVDFTKTIQSLLPGAAFGVATDLLILSMGFIVPLPVVISMFVGSLVIYIIGNPLLVRFGVTGFAKEYFPGWGLAQIMQSSFTHAWAGPIVGATLAAGVFPLIHHRHVFIQAVRSLQVKRERAVEGTQERILSLSALLALWLSASIVSVIVAYYLLPGVGFIYVLIMLAFSTLWSFVWTIASARAIGITGVDITVPAQLLSIVKYSYINAFNLSPKLWFIDPVISTGGSSWCLNFKIAERCGCTVKSLIKAFLIVLPIGIITNFFSTQYFWSVAPIPSAVYPQPAIFWPISVVYDSLWMSGRFFLAFDPIWIIGSFAVIGGLYGVIQITKIPISLIGLVAGMSPGNPIPMTFTMLLGGIISRIIVLKKGEDWWRDNRFILAAGIGIGEACTITVLLSISIIARSIWAMPF